MSKRWRYPGPWRLHPRASTGIRVYFHLKLAHLLALPCYSTLICSLCRFSKLPFLKKKKKKTNTHQMYVQRKCQNILLEVRNMAQTWWDCFHFLFAIVLTSWSQKAWFLLLFKMKSHAAGRKPAMQPALDCSPASCLQLSSAGSQVCTAATSSKGVDD